MSVQNRIVKVQKRNRALVKFDQDRIAGAILRAAQSIGGFEKDLLPGINDTIFDFCKSDDAIAGFLSDIVVICLNSDPHHLISNFPPTIEIIQDEVLHALRSYGFQHTADAYECYRWGRHWLREGAIKPGKFAGNGIPRSHLDASLTWNRARRCETIAGLNEIVRSGGLKSLVDESLAVYEQSLDDAASKVLAQLRGAGGLRLLWITGPSCSGKTTTTIKLTARLARGGVHFRVLNLDDYFWPVVEHPTDWINDRNYERPEALDIQLVNQHLNALLEGRTIEKPVFSFKEGRRTGTKSMRLESHEILLVDCLHGLYPPLTEGIGAAAQFRLYLDTQNAIYEGDGSTGRLSIPGDVRLLRRILRDTRHRNDNPLRTVLHWHYVRAGELFSIIPLSGLADHFINAGFPFDLPVMKSFFARGGLLPAPADFAPYASFLDARIRFDRVTKLLADVEEIPPGQLDAIIPGDAVIREFIGGSALQIPHNE